MNKQTVVVTARLILNLEEGAKRPPGMVGSVVHDDLLQPGMTLYVVQGQGTASEYRLIAVEIVDQRDSDPESDRIAVEKRREDLALRRNDSYVNARSVKCLFNRCGRRLTMDDSTEHAWKAAQAKGWRVHRPENPVNTDLRCPGEHDEMGNNKEDL